MMRTRTKVGRMGASTPYLTLRRKAPHTLTLEGGDFQQEA